MHALNHIIYHTVYNMLILSLYLCYIHCILHHIILQQRSINIKYQIHIENVLIQSGSNLNQK